MARLKNTVLTPGSGYSPTAQHQIVDLRTGGENGFMTNPKAYVSGANYVRRNLIAVLLQSPAGFNDLPNPEYWHGTLKALIELHSQTIEGLASTVTVEYGETPVGGAGEMQEDMINVTRQRSVPVHGYPEKYGFAVGGFHLGWINYLIGDPETKIPWVSHLTGVQPADFLPDYDSATVLYFEPDPTHRKVMKAWLCSNMKPKSSGAIEGRREIAASMEILQHSIEYTARTEIGVGVNKVAQDILDKLQLSGSNPNNRPAFINAVSADVSAVDTGYQEEIAEAAKSFIGS